VLGSFIGFVLMFTGVAHAQSIFVDKNSTASYEDGSAPAPFRTITRGLDLARKIRLGSSEENIKASPATINVHVAPSLTPYVGSFDPAVFDPVSPSYDPSKERLPLLLNIPRLNLRGETRLVEGEDGLPAAIIQGTETTIRSDRPQTQKQYMVMATRTFRISSSGFPEPEEWAGDDVTITGFWLQADEARELPSTLIAMDGVTGFAAYGNVLVGAGNGIWTRLASGRIEGNLAVNNAVGFYLTGGSNRFPATVRLLGNRVSNTVTLPAGLGLVGAGETGNRRRDLDFGANRHQFVRVPLPAIFSRALTPDEVPDSIYAEVVGNEFNGSTQNGIRITGYLQDPYSLVPGEDETANVTAVFSGNVSKSNMHYGLVVDAGQIALGDRRMVKMDLSFDNTTLEGNAFGPAIFSLWRYPGSISLGTTMPFSLPSPTFAHDSTIDACGDVTRFHYDNRQDPHPPTNPAPTNNRLIVNNVELTGYLVDIFFEAPANGHACSQ
jgi:hypothetical protein